MIRIVILIPYPELADTAEMIFRNNRHPGLIFEVAHAYGTKVDEMDIGHPDIILARGLTQQALKTKYPDIAVLELTTSAYDILHAIHRCRREHAAKKILVLGIDSIFLDVNNLKEIIDVEVKIEKINDEAEILSSLAQAREEGFDAVVGGLTVCMLAGERGWKSTPIRTGDETFRASVMEALNTGAVMFAERAKSEVYRSILDNTTEAVLYFDSEDGLVMYNQRAREMLSLPSEGELRGKRPEELIDGPDVVAMLRARQACSGRILTINGASLVSNFLPVRVEEQSIGIICTFQLVNEIQATESMIRRVQSKKGLTAKYGFADIIHSSETMAEVMETAHKYAAVDANVLLIGETGTGKELFAQSIHSESRRRHKPFVAVNCAAFPENLLESELFGYTEGAFSGAARGGKTGLFELAHGGTLFLDEVGEIPLTLQSTLLRALQEREIRKIGDDRVIPVNVRVIAATNLNLWERVEAGEFRMDLLYRLDVLSLLIPALRERKKDIGLIARHYIRDHCARNGRTELQFDAGALEALESYSWPGNARELKNVCERLVVLSDDKTMVTRDMVNKLVRVASPPSQTTALPRMEPPPVNPGDIGAIVQYADSMRLKRSEIAKMLGMSRTTLWRRMKEGKEA